MPQSDVRTPSRFHLDHRYLHIPIRNNAPKVRLTFSRLGEYVTALDIEPGTRADHDWMSVLNLSEMAGQTFDIHAENCEDLDHLLGQWFSADHADVSTQEDDCRPALHFTAPRGWLNDPNGLVYYKGLYHLFYQHNPCGRQWGNMHWGHAVSRDLLHWEHRDDKLHPDASGAMYSGSAVVDHNNTSGLQQNAKHPPICLFYTAAGNMTQHKTQYTQRLAYSVDGGVHWQKHDGPALVPTLTSKNRDPKVFYHQPTGRWVMTLYLEKREPLSWFEILTSDDLLHWESASQLALPGCGECPDLFVLPVAGEQAVDKWVFGSADGTYLIGEFDGKHFQPEQEPLRAYNGNTSPSQVAYATQTFSNLPDQRCVQMAWLRGDLPMYHVYNQQMTLPVELSLKQTALGIRLAYAPVAELDDLLKVPIPFDTLDEMTTSWEHPITGPLRLQAHVQLHHKSQLQLNVGQLSITIDSQQIRSGQVVADLPSSDVTFSLYIDTASVEIFACDGLIYMPLFRVPLIEGEDRLSFKLIGDSCKIHRLDLYGATSGSMKNQGSGSSVG